MTNVTPKQLQALKKASNKIIEVDERVVDVFIFGSAARNLLGTEKGKKFRSVSDFDIGITVTGNNNLKILQKIRKKGVPRKLGMHQVSYHINASPPEEERIILQEIETVKDPVSFTIGSPPTIGIK